ncbi:MAG: Decaprenyl-phosphate N-acetylglucosaminephosphotransferase [Pelotomaculum sp. PtaB.Bin104]|nr:MAG: Decaprenyl-phosphate N-acetylglucosaminephosphotransferase [Pelotomaculum sp. PtaB.Bin104]
MISGWIIIIILFILPLSYFGTSVVRDYTLRAGILDVPNGRSSHKQATPRGGGLAVAILFLVSIVIFAMVGAVPERLAIALCGGGLLVAGVGWIDDCRNTKAFVRAAVHLIAAIWALLWLGGLPNLNIGLTIIPLGVIGSILAVIGIVWAINLYNFMDGIDGIAGTEAIFVGLIGGILELALGMPALAILSMLLASACAGFLFWNWPPAKIFMGDAGSGLIGFSFAVIAIASENTQGLPLLIWVLLLGVFVVDATATLLRRIRQGDCWYKPHRSHAYQLAIQGGYSHKQVTLAVLWVNVGLAILAFVSWQWSFTMPFALLAGGAGLIILQQYVVHSFDMLQNIPIELEKYRTGTKNI